MKKHASRRLPAMALAMALVLSLLTVPTRAAEGERCTASDCDHVAAIGSTHFNTLQEAADSVTTTAATTIKLLRDVSVTGVSALAVRDTERGAGKNITLNLNGKTVTSDYEFYTITVSNVGTGSAPYNVACKSKLTIIGEGPITTTNPSTTVIQNYGTLTIGSSGAKQFPTVIRPTTTNTANVAVKCEEDSTLTIYGGTFTGTNGSVQNWGTTRIYGGTFTNEVEAWKWGDCASTLTITGGTFQGEFVTGRGGGATTDPVISVSGGTFTDAANPTKYLTANHHASVPATSVVIQEKDQNSTVENETITMEDEYTLHAIVTPTFTTDAIVWSSGDKARATVEADSKDPTKAVVTAVNAGDVTITVTVGKQSDKIDLVISGIELSDIALSMVAGKTATLAWDLRGKAEDLKNVAPTWESNNISVAGVKNGKITAYNPGTARITAKVGSYTATCVVTVVEDVADDIPGSVAAGKTYALSSAVGALNAYAGTKTESTLDYITGLSVPTSAGILYYGYVSPEVPGHGVSATEKFYYGSTGTGRQSINDLTFVPAAGFSGDAVISYTAYGTSGLSFEGAIRVTVTSSGDVVYTTAEDQPVTFAAEDFSAACRGKTGRSLKYVTFVPPSASQGTLYYNYSSASVYAQPVGSSTKYYAIGGSSLLDMVTFVPAEGYVGTVEIVYYYTDQADSTARGKVTITVVAASGNQSGRVEYTVARGGRVTLNAAQFNALFANAGLGTMSYLYLDRPAETEGTLYYSYNSASSYNTEISPTTKYYYWTAPYLSWITFVPNPGFGGTVTIPFTGYDYSGRKLDGELVIHVKDGAGTVYYAAARGQAVNFDGLDFDQACQSTNGAALESLTFVLPAARQGTLYEGYVSSSNMGRAVSSTSKYTPVQLDDITFVPYSSFTGVVSIPFSGYDVSGNRLVGSVQITVSSAVADGKIYYNTYGGMPTIFQADDFDSASRTKTGDQLDYVTFSLPSSEHGVIYYDNGGSRGVRVNVTNKYYCVSGERLLDDVYFLPNRDFVGTVELIYTGVSRSGDRYQGIVEVTVSEPVPQTLRYTGSALPVRFTLKDFQDVCAEVLPAALDYVQFTSLPAAAAGKLLQDYSGIGTGTQVKAGTKYYAAGSPTPTQVCFLAKADYQGTVNIPYTAADKAGNLVSGSIRITINNAYTPGYFSDTASYTWAQPAIDFMCANRVVVGYNGQYWPAQSMKRGDYVLMLHRLYKFANRSGKKFSDVPQGSYYAQAIQTAAALKIIEGDKNNAFAPERAITREEAATFLYKAMLAAGYKFSGVSTAILDSYPDGGQVDSGARTAMAALVGVGIFKGDAGKLNPDATITRAEIAVILHRMATL